MSTPDEADDIALRPRVRPRHTRKRSRQWREWLRMAPYMRTELDQSGGCSKQGSVHFRAFGLLPLVTLACAALGGCSFGHFQPVTAPTLARVPANTCPQITGDYAGKGTQTLSTVGGDCVSQRCDDLVAQFATNSSMTMIPESLPEKPATYVRVAQPDTDTLEISEWKDPSMSENPVTSLHLKASRGDFSCKEGMLWLPKTHHAMVLLVANAYVTEIHAFARDINGALVMRRTTVGVGHILTIPNAGYKNEDWITWPLHQRESQHTGPAPADVNTQR